MTHLTQITVDFASAARLRLRDCYDWHQAAWKAFPGPRRSATRLSHAARSAAGRFSALDRLTQRTHPAGLVSSRFVAIEAYP